MEIDAHRQTQRQRRRDTTGTQDAHGTRACANVYADGAGNRVPPPPTPLSHTPPPLAFSPRFASTGFLVAPPCLRNPVGHFTDEWGCLGDEALPFAIVPGGVLLNDVPIPTAALGFVLPSLPPPLLGSVA